MKTLPMIFNQDMVQALLDGRKVQTRRPIKHAVSLSENVGFCYKGYAHGIGSNLEETKRNFIKSVCPFAKGDLIYVRETFAPADCRTAYRADKDDGIHCIVKRWIPSIHMPRWASRLTLKVTGVRVEQVQSITKDDAVAEGFKLPPVEGQDFAIGARTNFRHAWQKIYGESWDRNDWVWVIDFEVINQNIDQYIFEGAAA